MTNPNSQDQKNQIYFEQNDQPRLKKIISYILEIIKIVIISLAIIIPVRYFLIQPFYVKGASMEPNFYDHEYLIIDEISYRFNEPKRGDIIVFKYPRDTSQYFIKRVIGLPNEEIEISDGKITVYNEENPDGAVIDETYLKEGVKTSGNQTVTLGPDEYFVLGDNRSSSYDSRSFGPITRNLIVGRTWIRGWPFDKIKIFGAPQYNF
jgi:signal peptidase I